MCSLQEHENSACCNLEHGNGAWCTTVTALDLEHMECNQLKYMCEKTVLNLSESAHTIACCNKCEPPFTLITAPALLATIFSVITLYIHRSYSWASLLQMLISCIHWHILHDNTVLTDMWQHSLSFFTSYSFGTKSWFLLSSTKAILCFYTKQPGKHERKKIWPEKDQKRQTLRSGLLQARETFHCCFTFNCIYIYISSTNSRVNLQYYTTNTDQRKLSLKSKLNRAENSCLLQLKEEYDYHYNWGNKCLCLVLAEADVKSQRYVIRSCESPGHAEPYCVTGKVDQVHAKTLIKALSW